DTALRSYRARPAIGTRSPRCGVHRCYHRGYERDRTGLAIRRSGRHREVTCSKISDDANRHGAERSNPWGSRISRDPCHRHWHLWHHRRGAVVRSHQDRMLARTRDRNRCRGAWHRYRANSLHQRTWRGIFGPRLGALWSCDRSAHAAHKLVVVASLRLHFDIATNARHARRRWLYTLACRCAGVQGCDRRLNEVTGRPVRTAAQGNPAFAGYEGHGGFTWALLDALKNGDRNGNGYVELSESRICAGPRAEGRRQDEWPWSRSCRRR